MHALYSNRIGYNDTYLAFVEWSAILGGPLRFQKTADPELDPDSVIGTSAHNYLDANIIWSK